MTTDAASEALVAFARRLMSAEEVKRFLEARHGFESDAEVTRLREAFNRAASDFQQKQAAGTLTEQDISRVRTLQSKLNLHPRAAEYLRAQQEMAGLLRDCNRQIFEVIGIDFSAAAIPAGIC